MTGLAIIVMCVQSEVAHGFTSGISADTDAGTKDFITGVIEGVDSGTNTDDLPYRLLVPTNYDPSKKYPLVYFFHGLGETGTNNESQLDGISDPLVIVNAENREKHPAFMLAPQSPVNTWVDSTRRAQKEELLQHILSEYNIDEDRIYVTGISLGGNSTWDFSSRNSDQIAALLPVAGWGPRSNLTGIPIWNFHAANDGTVDPFGGNNRSDENIAGLRDAGSRAVYTRYDTGGHAIWDEAYATVPMVDWMFAQRRGQESMAVPFIEVTLVQVDTELHIEGVVYDSTAEVNQVDWETSGGSSGNATGTENWSASGIPLQNGDNLITVTATGTDYAPSLANGKTTFNASVFVDSYSVPSDDIEAPMLTIESPTVVNGSFLTDQNTITVSGTASDNIGIANVTWSTDRGFTGNGTGTGNWLSSSIPLLAGTNYITITVSDVEGNFAQTFLRVWQNAAPTAQDDVFATYKNVTVDLPVLLNDSDLDESPRIIRLTEVGSPQHGQTRLFDGVIRYTPDLDYEGEDSFSYTISDGFETTTASVDISVGSDYPSETVSLFKQSFDGSNLLGDYIDSTSPDNGQWNDISANTDGGEWTIEAGALKLAREDINSSVNGAGMMRWTDLDVTPKVVRVTFDVAFLDTPNVKNTLVLLEIGDFGDSLVDYNSDTPSSKRSAQLEIAGNTTGRFRFALDGDRRGDFLSDGTYQRASWYVNTTAEDVPFLDPSGAIRILEAGMQSIFVGTEPIIENIRRRYPSTSPVDVRLRVKAPKGDFTMLIDNFEVSEIELLPDNTAPVVEAGADNAITSIATALLDGEVTDDGLPLGALLEVNWTKLSGPGDVTFGDPSNKKTTVSFFEIGTYVLQLQASDSELSASDTVTVTVRSTPFSEWLTTHFTSQELDDGLLSGDLADPDVDGIVNLTEYAMGLDPRAASKANQPVVEFNGTQLDFQFTRVTTRTDLTYEVLASSDLRDSWSVIARSVGGAAFVDVDSGTASIDESGSETISVIVTDAAVIGDIDDLRFMKLRILRSD